MKYDPGGSILFALGEHVDRVLYEHLNMDHPYNTYKHKDFPPTPIASPSLSSIIAAIHPEEHDFAYYVTKKEGTREHYFANTYEENRENIRISQENVID